MLQSVPKSCKNRSFAQVSTYLAGETVATNFSIMTYNLLSQSNIRREMYPYASKNSLKWKLRKRNLLEEIFYYKPDIVCLQEVNIEHWNHVFFSEFTKNGYSGNLHFSKFKNHGVAILTKISKFKNLEHIGISLGRDIYIGDEIINHPNVGQIMVMEFCSSKLKRKMNSGVSTVSSEPEDGLDTEGANMGLIIANTHLYWQPDGNFERLLQTMKLLSESEAVMKKYSYKYSLILCGDLNTTPDDALYKMLTTPKPIKLSEEDIEQLLPSTIQESDEEDLNDKSQLLAKEEKLESDLKNDLARVQKIVSLFNLDYTQMEFTSLYGQYSSFDESHIENPKYSGEPVFTNYTNWKGTLDYIMIQKPTGMRKNTAYTLKHRQLLLIPDRKYLSPGLPNENFSSDHISLVSTVDCLVDPAL